MTDREYRQDIKVDFTKLEENLAEQGSHYLYWGEKWADTEKQAKLHRRRLSLTIRAKPGDFGLPPSPSEAAVKAKIEDDLELIDLEHKLDVYEIAKKGFDHRGRSLDGLTRLYTAGYWSKSTASQEMIEQLGSEERRKQHIDQLNISRNRGLKR